MNRNVLNTILEMAEDGSQYSRIIRKTILQFFRDVQTNHSGMYERDDLEVAMSYARWKAKRPIAEIMRSYAEAFAA